MVPWLVDLEPSKVCLKDDVALVIGLPQQVEAAVQLILPKIASR